MKPAPRPPAKAMPMSMALPIEQAWVNREWDVVDERELQDFPHSHEPHLFEEYDPFR